MEDLERTGIVVNSMPELPEVETVKNVLLPIVLGRKIIKIDVLNKNNIEGDSFEFVSKLTGQTFTNISRKGKYLIFHLSDNNVFLSHLRLEGKYIEFNENEPNSKYAKVVFHLDNNKKLCYDDSRGFGTMHLTTEDNYFNEKEIAKLGPEPFYANPKDIYAKVKNKKIPIKTMILDQTLMAGLGNIYADETLYACKIHPHTPTNLITFKQWEEIIRNASRILNRALQLGGSTVRSYHPGKDINGNFQLEIQAYGKAGQTCPRCGKTFLFTKTNGRGTTYCPGCQKKLGKPLNIGITGKIASGKSVVLKVAKERGYDILSCDEVIKEVYARKEVINKINSIFKLNFNNEIDKTVLREYLIKNPNSKRLLENLIHPLVKKEIEKFMLESKSPLRFVEVPLLFKVHWEDMFDTLIVIDVDESNQLSRLNDRDITNAAKMLKINKLNGIEENKNKAEFLVNNNDNKEKYLKELNKIIDTLELRLG